MWELASASESSFSTAVECMSGDHHSSTPAIKSRSSTPWWSLYCSMGPKPGDKVHKVCVRTYRLIRPSLTFGFRRTKRLAVFLFPPSLLGMYVHLKITPPLPKNALLVGTHLSIVFPSNYLYTETLSVLRKYITPSESMQRTNHYVIKRLPNADIQL